jgi:hypothetical protein
MDRVALAALAAAAAIVASQYAFGAGGATPSVIARCIAAAAALALHYWVVWRGTWRWETGVLYQLWGARQILSGLIAALLAVGGAYGILRLGFGQRWYLDLFSSFAWLFLSVLPSKYLNAQADRSKSWHNNFCPVCNCLTVTGVRSAGAVRTYHGGGYATEQQTYRDVYECLVCGWEGQH